MERGLSGAGKLCENRISIIVPVREHVDAAAANLAQRDAEGVVRPAADDPELIRKARWRAEAVAAGRRRRLQIGEQVTTIP